MKAPTDYEAPDDRYWKDRTNLKFDVDAYMKSYPPIEPGGSFNYTPDLMKQDYLNLTEVFMDEYGSALKTYNKEAKRSMDEYKNLTKALLNPESAPFWDQAAEKRKEIYTQMTSMYKDLEYLRKRAEFFGNDPKKIKEPKIKFEEPKSE